MQRQVSALLLSASKKVTAALLVAALSGCALFRWSSIEIELVSIELVDERDRPELSQFGFRTRSPEEVFLVRIIASEDITDTYRGHTVFALTSICRGGKYDNAMSLSGYPSVYDEMGNVGPRLESGQTLKGRAGYEYFLFFSKASSPKIEDQFQYNFSSKPMDVCVQIGGGDVIGQSFRTNTLVIPKERVTAALAAARDKHD